MSQPPAPVVGCVSLEPWDEVWRRNQHFAHQLVTQGLCSRLVFVEPPILGRKPHRFSPEPGIEVVRPFLPFLKRYGGLAATGRLLRLGALRDVDILWINDSTLGLHCLRAGQPAVYDVTDDWRAFDNPAHIRERIVHSEDLLAQQAKTVVCSQVLADRWLARYAVTAPVVQNGVDLEAFDRAAPVALVGEGPHLGYLGTLHSSRLDVDLVVQLAREVGTVHLVGPDCLDEAARAQLTAEHRVVLHGAVPAADVPGWMKAMDVLVCPHVITEFTLSLDAIKAHEYAAAGRPVVATPTSGYQTYAVLGATVVTRDRFADAVRASLGTQVRASRGGAWAARAQLFAAAVGIARDGACA